MTVHPQFVFRKKNAKKIINKNSQVVGSSSKNIYPVSPSNPKETKQDAFPVPTTITPTFFQCFSADVSHGEPSSPPPPGGYLADLDWHKFWCHGFGKCHLLPVGGAQERSWEFKVPPPKATPPINKALLRDYLPLVSLNKALLNPYFWGGVRLGGLVE